MCGAVTACGGAVVGALAQHIEGLDTCECRILCHIIPTETCEACVPEVSEEAAKSVKGRFLKALRYSLTDPASSRYIFACATYLA